MIICWFSAGVSSFISAFLVKEKIDKIIYCHIEEQHPDTLRFLKDCEEVLEKPIEMLQSPYKSVENIINTFGYINFHTGAKCTDILKRRVRKEWEAGYKGEELTYIWGYDNNEKHRAERIAETSPRQKHLFPLISNNMSKEESHKKLKMLNIKRPAMYEMGYSNNNCVGCVRGGMGYWNKIRIDFPEVFALRAKQERAVGYTCIKGIYLDELNPKRGRMQKEIMGDCSIACQLNL